MDVSPPPLTFALSPDTLIWKARIDGGVSTMKTLSVTIPDEVYECVYRPAVAHGARLPDEVAEFVKRYACEDTTMRLTGDWSRIWRRFGWSAVGDGLREVVCGA